MTNRTMALMAAALVLTACDGDRPTAENSAMSPASGAAGSVEAAENTFARPDPGEWQEPVRNGTKPKGSR